MKVYCYFNQLGDGFYKQLLTKKTKIEGLEEEVKHLFLTHYFNILLYGRTGVGKSTFITIKDIYIYFFIYLNFLKNN